MSDPARDGRADIDAIWAAGHDLPGWFDAALAVPREDAFVEVDGAPVHYFRWGRRGGSPILMTHGFLAHARCWAFIAPLLAEGRDIVAFDLAGMGDSAIQPGSDNQRRAEGLVKVAEALGLFDGPAPPTIVAHSFGAGVALSAMEQAGERFAGLIACDLMIMRPERLRRHFEQGGGPPGSGRADRPNKLYPDFETARGRFVLSPPQDVGQPFLFDYMAYHSLRHIDDGARSGWSWKFDPQVFADHQADDTRWQEAARRIADLSHPIAMIYGENSKLFDADSAAYIREQGGGHVPMIAVPHAEHHLMLDQPLSLVTAIRSVLELWECRRG